MPVIDPKTGRTRPRRAFRGCSKLCKGFKGKSFNKCQSICVSTVQTGQKRGFSRIPKKRRPVPCSKTCKRPTKKCIARCVKRKTKVPKTRERP